MAGGGGMPCRPPAPRPPPPARRTPCILADVIHRAVDDHGWPADSAVPALSELAADPQTRITPLEHPGRWCGATNDPPAPENGSEHADEPHELDAWLAGSRSPESPPDGAREITWPEPVARLASQYLGRVMDTPRRADARLPYVGEDAKSSVWEPLKGCRVLYHRIHCGCRSCGDVPVMIVWPALG